jgi:CRISPR/Cas system-associated exonuclease Cas4 (RecB family)
MALRSKKGYMKLPKYATLFYVEKPDGEQLFEYVVDVEKMDAAKEKLEGFAESITAKNFHATPDMKKCGWCEFADICKESMK